ncbi:uncharacterized protein [Venturia canescens]|uniref:uncharacterized protein isoform X2 n=1 Tax=Venturia canescens TaxID=32260 RepID=UPI001C9C7C14|nr:uncharacterized protein LOC122414145 isoform X2 [Venturia canescens]
MLKQIILGVLLVVVKAEYESYHPRGWRPAGRPFEPAGNDRLQTYGSPPLSESYGTPIRNPAHERFPTTTIETPRNTATVVETPETRTTTPRSREPTTSRDLEDQDYDANPALAIANSFAFNRPVYVYNSFPFHAGLTFVK